MSDPNTLMLLALGKRLQLTCLTLVKDLSCELPDSVGLPPSLMAFFKESRFRLAKCSLNLVFEGRPQANYY